ERLIDRERRREAERTRKEQRKILTVVLVGPARVFAFAFQPGAFQRVGRVLPAGGDRQRRRKTAASLTPTNQRGGAHRPPPRALRLTTSAINTRSAACSVDESPR